MPTTKKTATSRRRKTQSRGRSKSSQDVKSKFASRFPIIHTDSQKGVMTWHDIVFHKVIGGSFILAILTVGTVGIAFYIVNASGYGESAEDISSYSNIYVPVSIVSSKVDTQEPEQVESLVVDVRNGTRRTGYASDAADALMELGDYVAVGDVGNAGRFDYDYNIVVDLTGGRDEVAGIARYFEARWLTELPAGEEASEADVVVILGGE